MIWREVTYPSLSISSRIPAKVLSAVHGRVLLRLHQHASCQLLAAAGIRAQIGGNIFRIVRRYPSGDFRRDTAHGIHTGAGGGPAGRTDRLQPIEDALLDGKAHVIPIYGELHGKRNFFRAVRQRIPIPAVFQLFAL